MPRYILDTQTVEWLNDPEHIHHASCIGWFASLKGSDSVCVSILSIYELTYSLRNLPPLSTGLHERLSAMIEYVSSHLKIIKLSLSGADVFASLKTKYRQVANISNKNILRHNFDLLIASQAIDTTSTLVTNDSFLHGLSALDSRLKAVDWTAQSTASSTGALPQ